MDFLLVQRIQQSIRKTPGKEQAGNKRVRIDELAL